MFKKSGKYVLEYKTREDAAEALKEDLRIKDIRVYDDNHGHIRESNGEEIEYLAVETNPLTPKRIKPGLESLSLGSVGSYFIWIKKKFNINRHDEPTGEKYEDGSPKYKTVRDYTPYLSIKLQRRFGSFVYGSHQPHMVEPDDWDGICWGTAQGDIGNITENCDWYWAVKYCLDLLEDWDDDDIEITSFALYLVESQLNENPKLKPKLIKALKKLYDKGDDFYEAYHGYSYDNQGRPTESEYDQQEYFYKYGIGKIRPEEKKNDRAQ